MRRPSPALVIALIALAGAWGGPAVAQSLIGGKQVRNNSLTSADLRDRSVRGRDLRSNTITGRNVEGLTGRDVLRNGLDGSDIDEDTLEAVPNATRAARANTADHAVTAGAIDKTRIARIAYAEPAGTSAVTLFEGGGLLIQARCTDAGTLVARAAPAGGPAGIARAHVVRVGSSSLQSDNDFAGGDSLDLVAGGGDDLTGTLTYWSPGGDVVTMQYLAQDGLGAERGYRCAVAGTAVHTVS